jgi:hypothetical protein
LAVAIGPLRVERRWRRGRAPTLAFELRPRGGDAVPADTFALGKKR